MKIIKIKQVHWYDAKAKQDAVTYKVWVDNNNQTELKYFTTKSALEQFQKTLEPKTKTVKKRDKPQAQ